MKPALKYLQSLVNLKAVLTDLTRVDETLDACSDLYDKCVDCSVREQVACRLLFEQVINNMEVRYYYKRHDTIDHKTKGKKKMERQVDLPNFSMAIKRKIPYSNPFGYKVG